MKQPFALKMSRWNALPIGRWLIGFAVVACMLAIGRPSVADTSPKHGGTLEFAVTVEPGNYDCHANISFAFLHPIAPHYSTLLKFDAANYPQIIGDLAQSWSASADRLTYTFKLRPNVLFHDGSRLTSADVKASYERIAHPPPGVVSARKVDYAAISSIDTPDPLHRRFSSAVAGGGDAGEFRLPVELHLQRRQARRGPRISQDPHARHRSIRLCRVRKGEVLAGPALGQIFSARQALSRWLPGGFHSGKWR